MTGHSAVMSGINHDHVETGLASPKRSLTMPAAIVADIIPAHRACLYRVLMPCHWPMFRADRNLSRVKTAAVLTVMHKLDACKSAVLMHSIHHSRQVGDITIIPHTGFGERLHIAGWVEVALFGSDDSPTALRFHAAHGDHAVREHTPHAVAVRDLVKPVWRRNRANFHRLEQDIVSGVALVAHDNIGSGCRLIGTLRGISLCEPKALIASGTGQPVIQLYPRKLPLHTKVPAGRPYLGLVQRAHGYPYRLRVCHRKILNRNKITKCQRTAAAGTETALHNGRGLIPDRRAAGKPQIVQRERGGGMKRTARPSLAIATMACPHIEWRSTELVSHAAAKTTTSNHQFSHWRVRVS